MGFERDIWGSGVCEGGVNLARVGRPRTFNMIKIVFRNYLSFYGYVFSFQYHQDILPHFGALVLAQRYA